MTDTLTPPTVGEIIRGDKSPDGKPTLEPFEGREVTVTSITIPNASGGLRESLKVDPIELHKGDRVTLVMECEVDKIGFDPAKGNEETWDRRHVLSVVRATFIDTDAVRGALDAQQRRIEEAEGVQQLDLDGGDQGGDDGDDDDVQAPEGADDLADEAGA